MIHFLAWNQDKCYNKAAVLQYNKMSSSGDQAPSNKLMQDIKAQRRTSKFVNFQKLQQVYDVPIKTKLTNLNVNQVSLLRENSIVAVAPNHSSLKHHSMLKVKDPAMASDDQVDMDLDSLDCCDEDLEDYDVERQNLSHNYEEVIKLNPLVLNKGSSCLQTLSQESEVAKSRSQNQLKMSEEFRNGSPSDLQNKTTGQDSAEAHKILHFQTQIQEGEIEEDRASDSYKRNYTVNTFDRPQKRLLHSFFGRDRVNYSPRNKIQGSMGKILSNEDLKYLSIRSETPRPEGASRKNSSMRKTLFEVHSIANDLMNVDLLNGERLNENQRPQKFKQPLSGSKLMKHNLPLTISMLSPSNREQPPLIKSHTSQRGNSPLNRSNIIDRLQPKITLGNFLEAPIKKGNKIESQRRLSGSNLENHLDRNDSTQFKNELLADQQSQNSSRRGGKTSYRTVRKISGSPGKRKVVLITKRTVSTQNMGAEAASKDATQKANTAGSGLVAASTAEDEECPTKKVQKGRQVKAKLTVENVLDRSHNCLNAQSQQIDLEEPIDIENNTMTMVDSVQKGEKKLLHRAKKLLTQDESEDVNKSLKTSGAGLNARKVRKHISCNSQSRFKSEIILPEAVDESIKVSVTGLDKPSNLLGILKKRTVHYQDKSPRGLSAQRVPSSVNLISKPKKTVKFAAKAQIHEYEKLKDISDTSSSDEDSDSDGMEQGQITEESKQYLYNKKEIELLSQVKKPFHKFIIPPDDPVFKYDYSQIFLKDRDAKKRFYNEFKVCRAYHKKKPRLGFDERTLKAMMRSNARKGNVHPFTVRSDGTKKHTRKTIVFDLDNTLVKSAYKKHKLSDYDSYIYVNILGTKRIRLYLSYRPFIREMLEQLRQDFELVLYSAQSREYTQKVAMLLTINPTESYPCVFHQVLCKEECLYMDDIDMHVSDMDILTENRNIKDIIMVSDSFGRTLKHLRSRVPVKSFQGSKKDYSMVALVRYLKGFIRVKDVREKIQLDFKTIDI